MFHNFASTAGQSSKTMTKTTEEVFIMMVVIGEIQTVEAAAGIVITVSLSLLLLLTVSHML